MVKNIGRIWMNGKCISGYVLVENGTPMPTCIKFAASTENKSNWIYPSREKQIKEDELLACEIESEGGVENGSIN